MELSVRILFTVRFTSKVFKFYIKKNKDAKKR